MIAFLVKIDSALNAWNIKFPHWAKFGEVVYTYCHELKDHPAPWYGKVVKVACDSIDLVTYNAYAFMGLLLCAVILF